MNWYKESQVEYPVISGEINGLTIELPVDNTGSISATSNDYEILDGIREVPFSDFYVEFTGTAYDRRVCDELKKEISLNKRINPLIVMVEEEGPYILEGGHRFDALYELGHLTFPAMVVIDRDRPDQ